MLRKIGCIWAVISLALLGFGLHIALSVPPDADQADVGRILYYHVPTWVAMSFCFLANLICSILYLTTRSRFKKVALAADAVAVSSAEMGVVFCFLGMATGSLWGRAVWGIWWTWDARLTATLVLWLIYLAYLMLRHVVAGEQMRTLAAVVASQTRRPRRLRFNSPPPEMPRRTVRWLLRFFPTILKSTRFWGINTW